MREQRHMDLGHAVWITLENGKLLKAHSHTLPNTVLDAMR